MSLRMFAVALVLAVLARTAGDRRAAAVAGDRRAAPVRARDRQQQRRRRARAACATPATTRRRSPTCCSSSAASATSTCRCCASPTRKALDAAFDALSQRVRDERKKGQRVELVVYYSGHADETGILLGGAHYDYARLRQRIRDVPADVHIAIVDSCASGSFTRDQGRRAQAAVPARQLEPGRGLRVPVVELGRRGRAGVRPASARRSSRTTSSRRCAAPPIATTTASITLTEAYQFAYEQTLGRTQNTSHGPQHPAYDMHLSGTGDVVITDLRSDRVVARAAAGAARPRHDRRQAAAASRSSSSRTPASRSSLALPNETYSVHVDDTAARSRRRSRSTTSARSRSTTSALHRVAPEETVARGVDERRTATRRRRRRRPRSPVAVVPRRSRRASAAACASSGPSDADELRRAASRSAARRARSTAAPVVGVAETGDLSLGVTVGDNMGFAYDMEPRLRPRRVRRRQPAARRDDRLRVLGRDRAASSPFAWKMPTEMFAVLELSPDDPADRRTSARATSSTPTRARTARRWRCWGDEAEAGAGLRFSGKLDGFVLRQPARGDGPALLGHRPRHDPVTRRRHSRSHSASQRGRVAGSGLDRREELRERHGAAMLRYPRAMATSIRIWSDYV